MKQGWRVALGVVLATVSCKSPEPAQKGEETSQQVAPEPDVVAPPPVDVEAAQAADTAPPEAPDVAAAPPEPEDCGVWPEVDAEAIALGVEASILAKQELAAALAEQDIQEETDDGDADTADMVQDAFTTEYATTGPLFPGGVMATGVREREAWIWTRVLRPEAEVRVRYQAGPACGEEATPYVSVNTGADFTSMTHLEGLRPDTRYRYVVEVSGEGESEPAYFTTAPVEDVPIRLAFGADIHVEPESYVLMDELVAARPDLYLSLGDWPYQDARPVSQTLVDYQVRMAESREHEAVQRFLGAMGLEGIWDDHEVLNDWDALDAVEEAERVRYGVETWRHYFPVPHAREGEIYRKFSWGPEVEIFMLDGRLHRGENSTPDTVEKTMLGDAQRAWLFEGLASSEATYKLIVTSVPLVHATTRDDSWDGYKHERKMLADHIIEEQIPGVVFLTADQHWLAVHHLPEGPKEFQVGPTGFFLRSPRQGAPPWVLVQDSRLNFGLMEYAPGEPPTLTFKAVGEGGELLYEEVVPPGVAALKVRTDWRLMAWTLTGAHVFSGVGSETLPWVTPGEYTITWQPLLPSVETPPPETLTVESGGEERFRERTRAEQPLFLETFNRTLLGEGWEIVDEGQKKGPSLWRIQGDALREWSDMRDDTIKRALLGRKGTFAWSPERRFGEGRLYVDLYVGDNDGFGVMYGMQDTKNYYRLDFDVERGGVRLIKVEGGAHSVIEEDLDFVPQEDVWQRLVLKREGDQHTFTLAGKRILSARDATFPSGAVGLFSWGMKDIRFDNLFAMPL